MIWKKAALALTEVASLLSRGIQRKTWKLLTNASQLKLGACLVNHKIQKPLAWFGTEHLETAKYFIFIFSL
jgi:hypothetical protein